MVAYNVSVRRSVACAPYGGPVALVRDDRKIVPVTGGATKPVVTTYTAAGVRLGAFVWERSRIMGMAWTSEEDLMLLEQSGEARPPLAPAQPASPLRLHSRSAARRCTCTACTGRRRRAASRWAARWRARAWPPAACTAAAWSR